MDIQPVSQQSMSDDQELAKVLAGINQQADAATAPIETEEVISAETELPPAPTSLPTPSTSFAASDESDIAAAPSMTVGSTDLGTIKKDALNDLRPLVDKLNVSAEEKFDTYLLLLRSTDDATLIPPAYEAARVIADETRRAQALLDTIKEIDFLTQQK